MTVTDFFAGELVTELLKQLLALSRKSYMSKSVAESLRASISQNLPIIQEIKLSGVELPEFRQSQLDRFSETLRDGLELANTALKSKRWNIYKNFILARKMEKLTRAVEQFFAVPFQAHILADLHHVRFDHDQRFDRLDRRGQTIEEALRALAIGSSGASRMVVDEAAAAMAVNDAEEAPGVGMDLAMRKMRELVTGRDDLSVVGAIGLGGSGKTTLVSQICRDDEVRSYFKERILFLTVSQSPNVDQLRSRIYGFLMGNGDGAMNPSYVVPQLCFNQPMGPSVRRLVVLDDVWSLADLENLVFRLPGCKTLVASRINFPTVVKAVHEMALLSDEQALSLFCLSAFGQDSIPPMANHTIVRQIVNECKGLPLALKVIGASLRDEPEMMWINASKRLARGETICPSHETHLLERMAISVRCLSEKVRECFIDLGAFPEDRRIPLDVLVNIWAELHGIDREEAFAIVVELANKNLLTLVKDSRFGDAYCGCYDVAVTQHDVLRDLAIHLSSRESEKVTDRTRLFMPRRESGPPKNWENNNHRSFNARIVSVHTGEMGEMDWFQMDLPRAEVLILNFSASDFFMPPFMANNMPNLKALVIINHNQSNTTLRNFPESSSLIKLRSLWLEKVTAPRISSPLPNLRKLSLFLCSVDGALADLSEAEKAFPTLTELTMDRCDDLTEIPTSLFSLPRLESLSLTNCHSLKSVPKELGRAGGSLQVLRLYGCPELRELPESLSELQQLEYLDVSQCVRLSKLPRGIENMERLAKIDMRDCSRFSGLPQFSAPARSLRHVVCDDDVEWLWRDAKKWLPNLFIQVAKKQYSLDWLNE